MAISLDEYDKINEQMPKRETGDEIELSGADEAALDRAWAESAKNKPDEVKAAVA